MSSYEREIAEAEAEARASTVDEHLWCLALAIGPDDPGRGMWEACDGTPVDVARHLTALSEGIAELRAERDAWEQSAARWRREYIQLRRSMGGVR